MSLLYSSNLFSSETFLIQCQVLETQLKLVLGFFLNKKDTLLQNALEPIQLDMLVAISHVWLKFLQVCSLGP